MLELLPISEKKTIEFNYFPTKIHALIFRLWKMVPSEKIAKSLNTTAENVREIAKSMGLCDEGNNFANWMEKGYITIIKAMWHLVPYEQMLEILGWDEQRLAYVLKEDDFLGYKMGLEKPDCERISYREFTKEEKERAEKIASLMNETVLEYEDTDEKTEEFDFFNLPYKTLSVNKKNEVELTNEWSIELVCNDEGAKLYAEDFIEFAFEKFGVKFSENSDKKIVVDINKAMKNEEDHEIVVEDSCIKITGASAFGVMRAFYSLMNLAESCGTLSFEKKHYNKKTVFKTRIIYSFCGLYSDVLDAPNSVSFPEELLKEYAKRGINGVWIQAVLYKLVPFKYDESLSEGWEARIKNLNNLIKRAQRYGIKVYLYINEPRAMPDSFFEKFPHLKGHISDGFGTSMCTSLKEVQDYVHDAFVKLTQMTPGLGGYWNICMSENLTHCYSRTTCTTNCPRCAQREAYEVAAEITTVMANAVHSVDKNVKFFVHTWAFSQLGEDGAEKFLKSVPKDVIIVAVSEKGVPFDVGGVPSQVDDYSMSHIGPGEWAKSIWQAAREAGSETCAKIQVNTTWECSTAPFLPVYDLVLEHLDSLLKEDTEHLYLSWTLGGYMSDNLNIASSYFFKDEENKDTDTYTDVLKTQYGAHYETVKKAATYFSEGFREYPFCIDHIYFGPSNMGCANIFFEKPSNMTATMTAFPYDDTKTWGDKFSVDIMISQYEKLCANWEKGLEIIKDMPVCEFCDMAYYGYSLFRSSLNQLRYYKNRDENGCGYDTKDIIKAEMNLTKDVYKIAVRNCAIGYEAANHYYVSKTMLAEKLVQCDYILNN